MRWQPGEPPPPSRAVPTHASISRPRASIAAAHELHTDYCTSRPRVSVTAAHGPHSTELHPTHLYWFPHASTCSFNPSQSPHLTRRVTPSLPLPHTPTERTSEWAPSHLLRHHVREKRAQGRVRVPPLQMRQVGLGHLTGAQVAHQLQRNTRSTAPHTRVRTRHSAAWHAGGCRARACTHRGARRRPAATSSSCAAVLRTGPLGTGR